MSNHLGLRIIRSLLLLLISLKNSVQMYMTVILLTIPVILKAA